MISRRQFMEAAGRLGLGAGVLGTDPALAARTRRTNGESLRTIHLEAREVAWELAPGKTVKAMAYNGRIPGPEIRVPEGELVRVILKNSLAEPTTIHWHGLDVPNPMDGVPGITQKPVAPGQTFVYEFAARPAGTRWYHTHVDEHRQLDLGLAALLIIDPAGANEPMAYDREVTLVLDDWVSGTGPAVPPTPEGVAGGGGMMGGRGMGGMMRGMMGDANTPPYDTMTINGKAYPATEPLRLRQGERVRLRLVNASNEHTHVVRLAGHRLHVTHTDGNPLRIPVSVDAIPLAPSERYDAVVIAERPGTWFFQCLQPGHADAGERMHVLYDGHDRARPAPAEERLADLTLWHPGLGRGRAVLPPASGETRTFDLTLSGGMMGRDVWTINRKVYPNTDPLSVKRGDRVRIRLGNMSPETHPMHLHGQSFRVLAINGVRYAEPVVKDTVDVAAHMGSAVVEFTAHNPGEWFFHCHKPMHMMGGMITLVKIR
ncbi:MAG: multicopper oxidase family protein [Candidatus Rokuibacteriota bacterium]